jgi:hypothetical protein
VSATKIEVIAIGEDRMYSVGTVVVSPNGDVYQISRIRGDDFHTSRHASGVTHWKSVKNRVFQKIRQGKPVKDFRGIEVLTTYGFGLGSLPILFTEYKMGKSNGIFAVDMREYAGEFFNLSVAILTEEGFPWLLSGSQVLGKRQIYVYPDCHPMIAITAGATIVPEKKG